jgi:flagellar hook-associated protein 3 FlgL
VVSRVSTANTWLTNSRALNSSLSAVQKAQQEVASGKRITRWSDDPVSAAQATKVRAQQAAFASWGKSADDAAAQLNVADNALQSMSTLTARAQSLAISAVSGALSPEARGAIADELTSIAESFKDNATASYLGRPVFGGTADAALSGTSAATATWVGDANPVQRQIGPDTTVDISVDGRALLGFGTPGGDVFSQLSALATAVRAGDNTGITAGQTALNGIHNRVLNGIAKVGAGQSRVESAQNRADATTAALTAQRSSLEEVSLPDAVLKLQNAQTSYQAALGATAKSNLPSLVDFLR